MGQKPERRRPRKRNARASRAFSLVCRVLVPWVVCRGASWFGTADGNRPVDSDGPHFFFRRIHKELVKIGDSGYPVIKLRGFRGLGFGADDDARDIC